MSDGQPDVGSPNTKVLTMIKTTKRKARIQEIKPPKKAMCKGASEKLTIPSKV